MDMQELAAHASRRTGIAVGMVEEVAEGLIAEIGEAIRGGGAVDLGDLGRLGPGGDFAPGSALAAVTARERLADVSGYDEGVAPSDS